MHYKYTFLFTLKNVDWTSFRADITCLPLYTKQAEDVDDFADQLDLVTTEILDRHCPSDGTEAVRVIAP